MASAAAASPHDHHGPHHGPSYYVKIWAILLVLLAISIAGPMLGVRVLTLITAFGIAIVKAFIVAANFMHLKIEKKFIHYLLYTMLIAVFLFFAGVWVDVMRPGGQRWENAAAHHLIETHAAGHVEGGEHEEHK
jgi:caa(3)-type oxidase subunit IV